MPRRIDDDGDDDVHEVGHDGHGVYVHVEHEGEDDG